MIKVFEESWQQTNAIFAKFFTLLDKLNSSAPIQKEDRISNLEYIQLYE